MKSHFLMEVPTFLDIVGQTEFYLGNLEPKLDKTVLKGNIELYLFGLTLIWLYRISVKCINESKLNSIF